MIRELTDHTAAVETQKQNLETAKQEAQAAAEQKAIEEVRQAVNALKENAGTADEEAVRQARELYDALSDEQKEQLGSALSAKLEEAERSVAKAIEEERKAQEAIEKERQEKEQVERERAAKEKADKAVKEKAEREKKAAAAKKLAEAQAAFTLNVKDGAKKLPIQVKKKNKKIKAVTLAAGDSLASAVSDHPENVSASVSGKTVVLKGRKVKGKATITVRTKYGAVRKFSVVVQKKKVKTKKIAVKKKLKLKVGTRYALTNVVVPAFACEGLDSRLVLDYVPY